jgi:hypothetical protein
MVTVLKVDNVVGNNVKIYSIYFEFIDIHGFSIFDKTLVKTSSCGEYEYLYLFMNQEELNSFIGLLLDKDMTIYSKKDYTDEMVSIVVNDKIDNFKEEFDSSFDIDSLVKSFYEMSITKDNILDKITVSGIKSLNNNDYEVLNQE